MQGRVHGRGNSGYGYHFCCRFQHSSNDESFVSFTGVIDLPAPVNTNLYFSNFCSCSTISKSPSVFEGLPRSDCQYEDLLRWMNLNHLQKDGYNFGMLSTL